MDRPFCARYSNQTSFMAANAVAAMDGINSSTHNPALSLDYGVFTRTFGSNHQGGCHFSMADASTRFISQNILLDVYRLLGQRASGEAKSLND